MNSGLIQLMFITIAFIGIAVPFVAISATRQAKKRAYEYERKFNLLANELNQLRKSMINPVDRILDLEKRNRRLAERMEQMELREKGNRQYDQAVKLVNKGSSVEDIMSICGLNRGEAELIKVMNEMDAIPESENQFM